MDNEDPLKALWSSTALTALSFLLSLALILRYNVCIFNLGSRVWA